MLRIKNKKILVAFTLLIAIVALQSYTRIQHHDDDGPPKNLKVLPTTLSMEEVHHLMKEYSISLGVHCGYCHVVKDSIKHQMDFASDEKPEKEIARDMIKMTDAINDKYLAKIKDDGHDLEQITCATCHHGMTKPLVSADSLLKSKPTMPPAEKK